MNTDCCILNTQVLLCYVIMFLPQKDYFNDFVAIIELRKKLCRKTARAIIIVLLISLSFLGVWKCNLPTIYIL